VENACAGKIGGEEIGFVIPAKAVSIPPSRLDAGLRRDDAQGKKI